MQKNIEICKNEFYLMVKINYLYFLIGSEWVSSILLFEYTKLLNIAVALFFGFLFHSW